MACSMARDSCQRSNRNDSGGQDLIGSLHLSLRSATNVAIRADTQPKPFAVKRDGFSSNAG